jgi:hypothetical protein
MCSIPLRGNFLVAYNHQFLSDVQLHSCLFACLPPTGHITNNLTLGITVKSGEQDWK